MFGRWTWTLAVVALAPVVTAQVPFLHGGPVARFDEAGYPNGLLTPETEQATVPFTLQVGCGRYETGLFPTTVLFRLGETPSYASAVLSQDQFVRLYQPQECYPYDTVIPFRVDLNVVLSRHAPAYRAIPLEVEATVIKPGPTPGSYESFGPFRSTAVVMPAYVPQFKVEVPEFMVVGTRHDDAEFRFHLVNFGNGETRVTTTARATSDPAPEAIVPPPEVILQSPVLSGDVPETHRTVVLAARPNPNAPVETVYSIEVRFVARSTQNVPDSLVDEQVVVVSLLAGNAPGTLDEFDNYAPGPSPFLALAALGAAFLFRRR